MTRKIPSQRSVVRVLAIAGPVAFLLTTYQNCAEFTPDAATSSSTSASAPALTSGATPSPDPSAPSEPSTPATPSAPTPSPVPTNLIWADEFEEFSIFNPKTKTGNWAPWSLNQTENGPGWGAEYDVSPLDTALGVQVYAIEGGALRLRTDKAPAAILPKIGGRKYTSGALRTRNPAFAYAYYEMRAQLPKGNGLWPAFWLMPNDGAWPPEIDVVEALGNAPTTTYATVHSKKTFKDAVSYGANHYQHGAGVDVKVDLSAGMHTYGCDFRADFITWYFDGKQIFRSPTPGDLVGRKMYIILDTALGGWNGNKVDASTPFPADFMIDYVRVYSAIP